MQSRIRMETFDAAKGGVEKAKAMLARSAAAAEKTGKGNRASGKSQIDSLARKMLTPGVWKPEGSSVGKITASGVIKEGEHRLNAFIVAAETDPKLKVSWNIQFDVPDDQAAVIQDGKPHTTADIFVANGLNKGHGPIVKFILNRGNSCGKRDVSKELEFGQKYSRIIEGIKERVQGNKIGTAPVLAAIIRGYIFYIVDKKDYAKTEEIYRYCDILSNKVMPDSTEPYEAYPWRLSAHFKDNDAQRDSESTFRAYELTELTLQKFLEKATPPSSNVNKQAVFDCRPVGRELFPLAGEPVPLTKIDMTPAYMIPLYPNGRTPVTDVFNKVIADKCIHLHGKISYPRIPNKTQAALYFDGKIRAVCVIQKTEFTPDGIGKFVISDLKEKNAEVTTHKLVRISRPRHLIKAKEIGSSVTKLTVGDIAVLSE